MPTINHGNGMEMDWDDRSAELIMKFRRHAIARRVFYNADSAKSGPLRDHYGPKPRYTTADRLDELMEEVFGEEKGKEETQEANRLPDSEG